MNRLVLSESKVNPDALSFIEKNNSDVVHQVISAVAKNKIVVVGMKQNPFVKKARKILEEQRMEYTYLSYGSYFSKWQQRLAIKLWSGWPTYPQVFIDGILIGGADELTKYLKK
jgi:monothiol glutaredoxin